MLLQSLATVACAAVLAQAAPPPHPMSSRDASIFADWQAAGPSDSRSPCPALNSLANHGILPRSGKNISLPVLTAALKNGLNVGADFALAIGGFAFDTKPTLSLTLDLDNLDKHGVIEHDASLSRQDSHIGNNHAFNQTIYNMVLSHLPAGATTYDFASAAAGRYARVMSSKAADPSFVYTPKELALSYGETALYLSVFGNPLTGNARVSWVKTLFQEERLAYAEGWRPTAIETSLSSLGVLIGQLQMASPPEALVMEDFTISEVSDVSPPATLLPPTSSERDMYTYPTSNEELISTLSLQAHPEGGFFVETERIANEVPSPFAEGQLRTLATQIYYLLTPESARGRMHMNKSATFHVLHSGRSRYTLMRPGATPGSPPEIKTAVMGEDHAKGEVRQLFVPGGWWKASEIPEEDLEEARSTGSTRVGALITEVVVPGFHWEDHAFLSPEALLAIFGGDSTAEGFRRIEPYVKPIAQK